MNLSIHAVDPGRAAPVTGRRAGTTPETGAPEATSFQQKLAASGQTSEQANGSTGGLAVGAVSPAPGGQHKDPGLKKPGNKEKADGSADAAGGGAPVPGSAVLPGVPQSLSPVPGLPLATVQSGADGQAADGPAKLADVVSGLEAGQVAGSDLLTPANLSGDAAPGLAAAGEGSGVRLLEGNDTAGLREAATKAAAGVDAGAASAGREIAPRGHAAAALNGTGTAGTGMAGKSDAGKSWTPTPGEGRAAPATSGADAKGTPAAVVPAALLQPGSASVAVTVPGQSAFQGGQNPAQAGGGGAQQQGGKGGGTQGIASAAPSVVGAASVTGAASGLASAGVAAPAHGVAGAQSSFAPSTLQVQDVPVAPVAPVAASKDAAAMSADAGLPAEADTVESVRAGGINSAQVLATMGGTEMRVGMHSAEFGSISIATTVSQAGVSTQIALDHGALEGALGQALSSHLSGMEERLGATLGLQARVEMHETGFVASSGDGRAFGGSGADSNSSAGASSGGGSQGQGAGSRGYAAVQRAAPQPVEMTEGRLNVQA